MDQVEGPLITGRPKSLEKIMNGHRRAKVNHFRFDGKVFRENRKPPQFSSSANRVAPSLLAKFLESYQIVSNNLKPFILGRGGRSARK